MNKLYLKKVEKNAGSGLNLKEETKTVVPEFLHFNYQILNVRREK